MDKTRQAGDGTAQERPPRPPVQERFLSRCLGKPIAIELSAPHMVLEGVLLGYDDYTLLVRLPTEEGEQPKEVLVFKHAVAFVH